jgi:DNA-binding transcriptional regulator GbsR (MarR family)
VPAVAVYLLMPDLAALITGLILDRPMCVDCIAEKLGRSVSAIAATLRTVQTALVRHSAIDRCRECDTVTAVFSIDRISN